MSEQPIIFQYQTGTITGGYSFSAYSNKIILPEYVKKLKDTKIREAIHYEAKTARSFYLVEVSRLKSNGEKINSFLVKRDATEKAKAESYIKFSDVWEEVERIYKENEPVKVPRQHSTANRNKNNIVPHFQSEGKNFIVAIVTLDALNEATAREGITFVTDTEHLFQFLKNAGEGGNTFA
jgi:hypothetical protein